MRTLLLLALLAASPSPARAGDAAPPSPELIELEKTLTQKREEKTKGAVTPEQYQAFLAEFRPDLAKTMERLSPMPANAAAHARILVLLGDHAAAVQGLSKALEAAPGNNTLTLALGQTYYEKADYAAALATAEEVLKHDPKNDAALFLKHSSAGRSAPDGQGRGRTASAARTQAITPPQAPRTGAEFTAPAKRKTAVEVPASAREDAEPKSGKSMPLWPLAVPLGAGLIGYGVLKSRGAWSEQEAVDPGPGPTPEEIERNRKRLKVATASVVIAFTAVYALPRAIRATPALIATVKTLSDRSGQSLQQVTASELGAIGPEASGAMQKGRAILNANQAIIDPRKLTEYSLSMTQPEGLHKARVFKSALGFTAEHADEIIAQVRRAILTSPATPGLIDKYGARMTVDVLLTGPVGQATVRTGWIYAPGSTTPKLTTIFVK